MAPALPAGHLRAPSPARADGRILLPPTPPHAPVEGPRGLWERSERSWKGPLPVDHVGAHVGGGQDHSAFVAAFVSAAGDRQTQTKTQRSRSRSRQAAARMSIVPNLKLMSNSERGKYYRRRKKMYTEELERSVAELREQVAALSVARHVRGELALSATRTPLGSSARLVVEYCRQFALGAPVRLQVNEEAATAELVSKATASQAGFLRAVMEKDVRFGEFSGIDLLLDQWERYSIYHSSIRWTLRSLEVVRALEQTEVAYSEDELESAPVVIAIRADLTVRFSRRTIEEVFPHLLQDEELVKELIGLEVTYPCVNHFHFNERGRIEWYNPEVDFVAALMGALGSITKVGKVLGHALIAKDHLIGEVEGGDAVHVSSSSSSEDWKCDPGELESKVVHVVEDSEEDEAMGMAADVRSADRRVVSDVSEQEQEDDWVPSKPAASERANRMDVAFLLG